MNKSLESLCKQVFKKTLAYSLISIEVNDDGTTTEYHSEEFLDNHPERRDSPELTEEEKIAQLKVVVAFAKTLVKLETK